MYGTVQNVWLENNRDLIFDVQFKDPVNTGNIRYPEKMVKIHWLGPQELKFEITQKKSILKKTTSKYV